MITDFGAKIIRLRISFREPTTVVYLRRECDGNVIPRRENEMKRIRVDFVRPARCLYGNNNNSHIQRHPKRRHGNFI